MLLESAHMFNPSEAHSVGPELLKSLQTRLFFTHLFRNVSHSPHVAIMHFTVFWAPNGFCFISCFVVMLAKVPS